MWITKVGSVSWALQQINSATRIEGQAAVSAPPFFQSAGRGDLLFCWGEEGPTVVIWESLSEQEKVSWLEEASTAHDWIVWWKPKKGRRKSAHLSSAGKRSSLSMMKRNRNRWRKNGTRETRVYTASRVYNTGHGGSKAISKWQWARIMLYAGFTKISLSRQNKFLRCWQQRGRRAETWRTNVKYDWQVSRRNTTWAQRSADQQVTASKAQSQRVVHLTRRVCEIAEKK